MTGGSPSGPLLGLRQAIAFLTAIGGPHVPTRAALAWFAPVGAAVGAVVGLVWWSTSHWWALGVAAALALVADAALTGLLHLDGLADSADGLLPPVTRERRLEILRDPRSGAFAVVGVVLVVVLRVAALGAMVPDLATVASVASIWATARLAMAVAAVTVPYARADGLATAFAGGRLAPILLIGVPVVAASPTLY